MKISVILVSLNEEKYIKFPLDSLRKQSYMDFETILVDGGSVDKTVEIAKKYDVKVIDASDAISKGGIAYQRNLGALKSVGEILVFTEADTILPPFWLKRISNEFKDEWVIAVAGPGYPYDAPRIGTFEYHVYNLLRFLFSKTHRPFKRFMTSGYNLAVRKEVFEQASGFPSVKLNDDGLFGRKLATMGKVVFCLHIPVYISARRLLSIGFMGFNTHYLFMLENVISSSLFNSLKERSLRGFYKR